MDLIELQTGFWTGLLIIIAIGFAIWGLFYAATFFGQLVWIAMVALIALAVWAIGKRIARRLVDG